MIEIIVDTLQAMDSNRIPLTDYRELVIAHNANLSNSEDNEEWFDVDENDNLSTMSDEEWFNTFFSFEFV